MSISRAAIYSRISEDAAGDEHGVSNQLTVAHQLAAARGWEVVHTFSDNDISATTGKYRPDYHVMMAAAARGEFDAIIVFHTSRLWRNRRERADGIEILRKPGVSVVAVKGPSLDMSTAYGRGMAGMLGEFDTMEAEVKSERQQLAAIQRAENGKPPLGTRLTGYTTRGELVPGEAATVRQIFERFHAGDSLRGIVAWLTDTGVPTWQQSQARAALERVSVKLAAAGQEQQFGEDERARLQARVAKAEARLAQAAGRPWHPSSVRTILTNPRYAGRAVYAGRENGKPGKWEPVVQGWLFDMVQAKLADPRRRKQVGTDRKHLGSGLYLCGVCQRPVQAHTSVPSGQASQLRYRCPEGGHITRTAARIDEYVLAVIRARLGRPDLAGILSAPDSGEAREIAEEIQRQRTRLVQVEHDYDADLIDAVRYKVKREKISCELEAAQAAQLRLAVPTGVAGTVGAPDPVAAFDAAPLGIKRAVISFFMAVRLMPAPRGKHFDRSSVQIIWRHGRTGETEDR